MLKKIVKPLYRFVHDFLYATSDFNPLFKHHHQEKKIKKGFIGDEHLNNPKLDEQLVEDLKKEGIEVTEHFINIAQYKKYLSLADYPKSYYGGGFDPENNFMEKTLEHYVSTEFINFNSETVFLDVAACTSPFYQIAKRSYGFKKSYQQDLIYPKGIHGDKIGGYAHETNLPDKSIDAITLHCSLEHFEDQTDMLFFKEVNRILKPNGKCLILPFYFAHAYTIHVDPAYNLLRNHHPKIDAEAELRYCNWYQFHSRHYDILQLKKRIISQLPDCKVKLFLVKNFNDVDDGCYLRWILEISK